MKPVADSILERLKARVEVAQAQYSEAFTNILAPPIGSTPGCLGGRYLQ